MSFTFIVEKKMDRLIFALKKEKLKMKMKIAIKLLIITIAIMIGCIGTIGLTMLKIQNGKEIITSYRFFYLVVILNRKKIWSSYRMRKRFGRRKGERITKIKNKKYFFPKHYPLFLYEKIYKVYSLFLNRKNLKSKIIPLNNYYTI